MAQNTHDETRDVVVIGAGPGGAVTAAELAGRGLDVLLLEREAFPRYHIGESLTGTAGDFIRRYALVDDMARLDFPEKTGVKVIGRHARSEFFVPVLRPTWQVRRGEFDQLLLDRSIELGAEHRLGTVTSVHTEGRRVTGVGYESPDAPGTLRTVRAEVVVDASGHSAVLSRHGIAGPRQVDAFGRQIACFTQVEGAARDPGEMGDNTFIFYGDRHHWAWFIPLSPTLVSVGVVMPIDTYKARGGSAQETFAWGVQHINDDLARRMTDARPAGEPVRTVRNYSYRIEPFAGEGWVCVGDAHRFADPIFSFGVSFSMTEGEMAARCIAHGFETGDMRTPLQSFQGFSNRGQDRAFDLIRYFWRFPAFFGFQARGAMRSDFVKLLAGDCFDEHDLAATEMMRTSLALDPPPSIPSGRPREIARRVHNRYQDFQGLDAAHITLQGAGICLSFFVDDGDDQADIDGVLHDFEESLYAEFGRDDIAVLRYPRALYSAPSADVGTHVIFDRIAR